MKSYAVLSFMLLLVTGFSISVEAEPVKEVSVELNQEDIEPPMHISGNDELLQKAAENDWPGTGTKEDPIVIQGYRFHSDMHMFTISHTDLYVNFTNNWVEGMHHTWCALVISLTKNVIICNNTIFGGAIGVHLLAANDSLVTRNTIYDSGFDAVFMDSGSTGNIITDNYCYDNKETGVMGWTGSTQNVVSNNLIIDSDWGVAFRSGSNRNYVINNTIERTRISGVDLETTENEVRQNLIYKTSGDGIRVFEADNLISDNIIVEPEYRGIYLAPAANRTTVLHNSMINCTLESIFIMQSAKCIVRYNDFLGESEKPYAVDHGLLNVFEMNYWDGFLAIDENHDGVFDSAFEIGGNAQNRDQYPVTSRNNPDQRAPVDEMVIEPDSTEMTTAESSTSTTNGSGTAPTISNASIELLVVGGGTGVLFVILALIYYRRR
ncbi:MAG: nitrous oxide reductase family maturation protein NosD [Candidatus Thorarchaeota archaeon]